MQREFNVTGICHPQKHYMVDTSAKLRKMEKLVEKGKYFTINSPRQFGKTTSLFLLKQHLHNQDDYFVIKISFEGIEDLVFTNETTFSQTFVEILADAVEFDDRSLADFLYAEKDHKNQSPA